MSILRLPLEEIAQRPGGRPDHAGAGRRPPWRLRRGRGDAAERARLGWALLAWVLVLATLLVQDPERMTFDTKLGVNIDPVGFYERLWHLWNPLEYLGSLQDQYIGYAFPMGLYYLTAHLLHVPVWVAERLWMSLLIAVGFWGLVRLAETLGIGSHATRLLAGAVFALWPTFTILVGSSSGGLLPGLLAPWAVVPLARSTSARAAAARSGIVVACMGGINAVSTLAALVLPGMFILTRPGRRRWTLAGWWAAALAAATLWWAGPLLYQSRYGFNFLPYIEQAATTFQTMSGAAVLRGTGNWVAYLNFGQPWLTAGAVMTGSAWAVAAGAVAAATGLAGLARRDLPEGLWLRCTAAVAAVWALAGYAGPLGGPLHQQVQTLMNGPLAPLRNTFKIEPVLAAALALGTAHLLARAVWPRRAARAVACVAAAAVLAGLGLPYLNGNALQPGSFRQVPGYWQQAAAWLAAHNGTETTLVAPADAHGIYTWGQPIDEPLEPLADSPWAERNLVPFSGGAVADLLDGAERAIESGAASPGLAGYLARAGIRYVLVRNDLDPAQLGYTPPVVVHATLRASGFTRVAAFGPPSPSGPVGQGTALQVEAIEPEYPPVEIFQAASAAGRPGGPASVLPAADAALVDGGPAALLQLTAQGLLGTGQPAMIAGQNAGIDLPLAAAQDVTDSLRRADTVFGLPNGNTSYTYTASGTIPPDDPQGAGGQPPRQLLPAGTAGHQTVAVLAGAASVTASSAGSWLWEVPQGDPVNAFDGAPSTAWTEASPASAAGQWIQINFTRPRRLSGPVAIRLLDDIPRPVATRLIVTTAAGSAVTATRATAAPQPLKIPSGTTGWLRITIAAASGGTPGGPGAGIAEVAIPGVRVTEYLQPAQERAAPSPSFSFQRDTATTLGLPGDPPEADLNRTFTTQATERVRLSAAVAAVPGAALDTLLGRLDAKAPVQLGISASSTFGSLPALRPQNLLGGGTLRGWIAAGPDATLHLRWTGRRSIDQIQLTAATMGIAAEPTRVLITSPDGTRDVPVPQSGILRFPALVTDQMDIGFPGVMATVADNPLLGRAQQLPVGIGALSVPALAGLNAGIPASTARFSLACGQGPPVTLDGRTYATAVSGTVGDLVNLTPLALRLCTGLSGTAGSALTLRAGRHSLTSPGTGVPLAVTSLSLTNAGARPTTATGLPAGARPLRVNSWGTEYRTMTIGPGSVAYLEVHQAISPGWVATLNGKPLTPVTLDGWQQAFVVPRGSGGTVVMSFTPVTGYHWLLLGSVLAACVLIAAAAWPSRRRPRRHAAPPPRGSEAAGYAGHWIPAAGAALVLAVVGGPLAAAVPVVILLGWRRPRWVPWLAFTAMCVAGVVVLTGLSHGPESGSGAFGWPAQAAALTALAAALTPLWAGTWPPRKPPAADSGEEDDR
jgi:arabinofuranan 3-O-arabinosyltransferase